jgi:hypothetical protein
VIGRALQRLPAAVVHLSINAKAALLHDHAMNGPVGFGKLHETAGVGCSKQLLV